MAKRENFRTNAEIDIQLGNAKEIFNNPYKYLEYLNNLVHTYNGLNQQSKDTLSENYFSYLQTAITQTEEEIRLIEQDNKGILSRIEDTSELGRLELKKVLNGVEITVKKDPNSDLFGNSVQFNKEGSRSPKTYEALLELFINSDNINNQISTCTDRTGKAILEIFIEENGDIVVSTKHETVKISPVKKKIKYSLDNLYATIRQENRDNPIKEINT